MKNPTSSQGDGCWNVCAYLVQWQKERSPSGSQASTQMGGSVRALPLLFCIFGVFKDSFYLSRPRREEVLLLAVSLERHIKVGKHPVMPNDEYERRK